MNGNSGQLRTPILTQGKTVNQQATRGDCNRLRMERIREFMIMRYNHSTVLPGTLHMIMLITIIIMIKFL